MLGRTMLTEDQDVAASRAPYKPALPNGRDCYILLSRFRVKQDNVTVEQDAGLPLQAALPGSF